MSNTEPQIGVGPALPPRKTQMALAATDDALLILIADDVAYMMGGRDVSTDDAYTDGLTASVAPNASTSEGRTDGHPSNACQANGPSFFTHLSD